jgi:hypothetical protein
LAYTESLGTKIIRYTSLEQKPSLFELSHVTTRLASPIQPWVSVLA